MIGIITSEFAGLNLGEVEDVAEDVQQGVHAFADGAEVMGLLVIGVAGQQHLGEPLNAIQRRAHLVAHGGKEQFFGVRGRSFSCGPPAGLIPLLPGLIQLGPKGFRLAFPMGFLTTGGSARPHEPADTPGRYQGESHGEGLPN